MHIASGNNASGGSLSDQDLNDTLYRMARWQAPDMSVIDGYQGMQGNGPLSGTAVNLGCAAASLDWLAADRVAVELMNINAGRDKLRFQLDVFRHGDQRLADVPALPQLLRPGRHPGAIRSEHDRRAGRADQQLPADIRPPLRHHRASFMA